VTRPRASTSRLFARIACTLALVRAFGLRDAPAFPPPRLAPLPRSVDEARLPSFDPSHVAETVRASTLRRAHELAIAHGYDNAKNAYRSLLRNSAEDDEARIGLARVEAWTGDYEESERHYREVTARHPESSEASAGLADLLVWRQRAFEAEAQLDAALERTPNSADLLMRKARLLQWRGDIAKARRLIERAEALEPDNEDVRHIRERMPLGEVRLTAHAEQFPGRYRNLYGGSVLLTQTYDRFRFSLGHDLVQRYVTQDGRRLYDGIRSVSAHYSFAAGGSLGLEVGFASPGNAVPAYTGRVEATYPLPLRLTATASYALWFFRDNRTVHILSPGLSFAASEPLDVGIRAYFGFVDVPGRDGRGEGDLTRAVASINIWGLYRATPRLTLGLAYTYGTQVDKNPAFFQLIDIRSHIATSYADYLFSRTFGVRPTFGAELRYNATRGQELLIYTYELSSYVRW
jgi:tetratricopeptide (TPR) repeat protein